MADKERLDKLEQEIEKELGLEEKSKGQMTTEEAGKIGGHMVKRLIEEGKESEEKRAE